MLLSRCRLDSAMLDQSLAPAQAAATSFAPPTPSPGTQGSLHYTPEHCLVNGGFPFWWKKPCFEWAKCIFSGAPKQHHAVAPPKNQRGAVPLCWFSDSVSTSARGMFRAWRYQLEELPASDRVAPTLLGCIFGSKASTGPSRDSNPTSPSHAVSLTHAYTLG